MVIIIPTKSINSEADIDALEDLSPAVQRLIKSIIVKTTIRQFSDNMLIQKINNLEFSQYKIKFKRYRTQ